MAIGDVKWINIHISNGAVELNNLVGVDWHDFMIFLSKAN